jgi:hypothetical protein
LFVSLVLEKGLNSTWLLFHRFSRQITARQATLINRTLSLLTIAFLIITASQTIIDYFSNPKSLGREISQILAQDWRPGDQIWVSPWYEPLLYRYYLEKRMGITKISDAFVGIYFNDLIRPTEPGRTFLIAPANWPASYQEIIIDLGFKPYRIAQKDIYAQALWLFNGQ